MPSSTTVLSNRLNSHLNNTELTRKKAEKFFAAGSLVRRDLELIYSGLFLDTVISFERLLENLFVGMLTRKMVHPRRMIGSRMPPITKSLCWDLLLTAGKNYVEWIPYNRTEDRAKAYFKSGSPFCDISPGDRDLLIKIVTIRNVIAHRSDHSIDLFKRRVLANLTLRNDEKSPSGFLRSQISTAPVQTRYEDLALNLARIARQLTN